MEAWKFINRSDISPIFALSLTTSRWGLEPFPGNLLAIPGYLPDIIGTNGTNQSAWTLPYTCSTVDLISSSYESLTGYDHRTVPIDLSSSSKICLQPQPCADSGCYIIIEGAGRKTIGPAHSNIVSLTYGITTLIIIFLGVAINMGKGFFGLIKTYKEGRREKNPISEQIAKSYNAPSQPKQRYAEPAPPPPTPVNMSKEVGRCSNLLRQMYALDIAIWGMGDCVPDEYPKRDAMKRKANALFNEICRMIYNWRHTQNPNWSAVDRMHIEEIYALVDTQDPRRYRT